MERIGFFWLMLTVTAKYIVRGDALYVNIVLDNQRRLLQEVRSLVTGHAQSYRGGARGSLATTTAEQVAAVRQLSAEMLALLPDAAALGGEVPAPLLRILDTLLALADV